MMNQYPYMDPGQTSTGSWNASQSWGEQPASPAGDWIQRGAQTWVDASNAMNNYLTGNDPRPQWNQNQSWQQNVNQDLDWTSRHVADMIPGTGMVAGPVRAIKSPIQGGFRTLLQYYKDANPAKTLGELSYSKLSGQAPVFENIVSSGPRATGELMQGLQKRLGPMLDSMEITNIQPQAVSFWDKIAGRLGNYPNLQQRVSDEIQRVRNTWGSVPESSYQSNPYKALGFFE